MRRPAALYLLAALLWLSGCGGGGGEAAGNFPFPLPEGAQCEESYGAIYCRDINDSGFEAYRARLLRQGWQAVHTPGEYSLDWWFVKDNEMLHVLDQTFSDMNEIRLTYTPGAPERRRGALTRKQALPIVQRAMDAFAIEYEEYEFTFLGKKAKYLAERDLPGTWKATGMQLFQAFTDEEYLGTYLLGGKGTKGLLVFFEDFNGPGESCGADIDHDGQNELLHLYGSGSGIFRYRLCAYKISGGAVTLAYQNTWYPAGGSHLQLRPVSNSEVHLIGREGEDYGTLRVEGSKLLVDAENFPFREQI